MPGFGQNISKQYMDGPQSTLSRKLKKGSKNRDVCKPWLILLFILSLAPVLATVVEICVNATTKQELNFFYLSPYKVDNNADLVSFEESLVVLENSLSVLEDSLAGFNRVRRNLSLDSHSPTRKTRTLSWISLPRNP